MKKIKRLWGMMMCIIFLLYCLQLHFLYSSISNILLIFPCLKFENREREWKYRKLWKVFLLFFLFIFVLWGNPSLALCYGNFYYFLFLQFPSSFSISVFSIFFLPSQPITFLFCDGNFKLGKRIFGKCCFREMKDISRAILL